MPPASSPRALAALLLLAGLGRAQTTTLVSVNLAGAPGNGESGVLFDLSAQVSASQPGRTLSADGRYVVFQSLADDLVPGDTNQCADVFVRDLTAGVTTRVSVDSAGAQADSISCLPAISPDGRWVAFVSWASNLVPGAATAGFGQVYRHELATGTTICASVGLSGLPGNFRSGAWVHVPTNPFLPNTFLGQVAVSDDGRVAFASQATDLVPNAGSAVDVFVRDPAAGRTVRASVGPTGTPGNGWSGVASLVGGSFLTLGISISADGRWVAFGSRATNLVPGVGADQLYVHDLASGTTICASRNALGLPGDQRSRMPALSADGRFLGFESAATNLVPGDTNAAPDVFRCDLAGPALVRATLLGSAPFTGGGSAPALSGSGRYVVFESSSDVPALGDTNAMADIFVRDLRLGRTSLRSLGPGSTNGNGWSSCASISDDGATVAFSSSASNLVAGDANGHADVFVRR